MRLEEIQYRDSPVGRLRLMKPIITGNIHCIICWVCCWVPPPPLILGVVIFMETHMEAPTSTMSR